MLHFVAIFMVEQVNLLQFVAVSGVLRAYLLHFVVVSRVFIACLVPEKRFADWLGNPVTGLQLLGIVAVDNL